MKHIFLIGDSIRFGAENSRGYGCFVKEMLAGKANVYYPDENCRFAQYTLRHLHDWAAPIECDKIDIVHWNNGLWDVLRLFGDEPLTPCEVYISMLERVYNRIKLLFPNAEIIFATSTPIYEEIQNPDFIRYNSEIIKYNEEACKLMESLGVKVNDLYRVAEAFDKRWYSDFVHYTDEGCKTLAKVVVDAMGFTDIS